MRRVLRAEIVAMAAATPPWRVAAHAAVVVTGRCSARGRQRGGRAGLVRVQLAGDLGAFPLVGEGHVDRFRGCLLMLVPIEPTEDRRDQCVEDVV